ncbi:MAG: hypothetical protein BroJett033_9050 [Chloroflexota bacterium]|nr:MAG: hypothetical protein BroJett033_9050 [Chloroflexota bacterium]
MNQPGDNLKLGALLNDARLLLLLFIGFRVALLLAYEPLIADGLERGLTAQGDYAYYHALAQLTERGLLPFRDWWSEFPPVWAYVITAVYRLQPAYGAFATLIGFVLLLADAGNLLLLRRIGAHLHGAGTGMALAWVYALLAAPLVFTWWNFEVLVAFFLLLGLWWLLCGHPLRTGAAVALGALTKFTPALLLGAAWRFRAPRWALRSTAVAAALFVLAYLPLLAQNAAMTAPSLTAQFGKASYQTVWALLDGNYTTGNFGALASHLDPAQAGVLQGRPAVVPGWLRLGAALAVGAFVFARTRRFDDIGLVAFAALTLLIFFLQAQGWSPQWLVQIIPLALLVFPNRTGALVLVMLTLVTFAEYPLLFIRTGASGGHIGGALTAPFVVLVLTRTVVLAGLSVALYRKLRQDPVPAAT